MADFNRSLLFKTLVLFTLCITFGIYLVLIIDPMFSKSAKQIAYLSLFTISAVAMRSNFKFSGAFNRLTVFALLLISLWGISVATYKEAFDNRIYSNTSAPLFSLADSTSKADTRKMKVAELTAIDISKQNVRSRLKDSKSAEFRNILARRNGPGLIICGEVNSKNSFGGYTGFQRFIASGDSLVFLEEQVSDFQNAWTQMCH